MLKKVLVLLCALALSLSFIGCGKEEAPAAPDEGADMEESAEGDTEAGDEGAEAESTDSEGEEGGTE
jgi:hypothetical protein